MSDMVMSNNPISTNISKVRHRIRIAARETGRSTEDIGLLAVSKTRPAQSVRQAWEAGLDQFGENYLQEALDKMAQVIPDVVLTDMIMPNMGGLELVAIIRKRFPVVPAVLMTSVGNEESAVRALQKGAASYVPKKNLQRDLCWALGNVLDAANCAHTTLAPEPEVDN